MQQRHGQGHHSGHSSSGGGTPASGSAEINPLLRPPAEALKYFKGTDAKGRPIPRPDLLDSDAETLARKFAAIPASQLRRFYGAVTSLKRQLEIDQDYPDEAIRARLALLKAHAAYASKRIKNMPDEFVKFIVRHAHAVQNRNDFLFGFAPHFEAVVAYHKMYEKKDQGGN